MGGIRKRKIGKLRINWIVSRSVIYLSGSTQGSEFWADLLKVSSSLEITDSKFQLVNCWSLVKVWNIEQYFVHWYCESLHQITGIYGYHEWQLEKTPTVSPDPGATGGTATSDRDGKGKCARCSHDLLECKLKELKEWPCKHYCHSSCVVLFYEIEWEEAYCSCRRRIPSDWLQVTVDEIKEQLRRDELECLVCTILVTKEDPSD